MNQSIMNSLDTEPSIPEIYGRHFFIWISNEYPSISLSQEPVKWDCYAIKIPVEILNMDSLKCIAISGILDMQISFLDSDDIPITTRKLKQIIRTILKKE